AQCLHWLMLPISWAFSATRARTTRGRAGGCRNFESAFRRNCAANSAGRRGISDYGRRRMQLRTGGCGEKQLRRVSQNRLFSFRSFRLPLSKAASANLNSKHSLREKKNLAAATLYFPFFTSRLRR